MAQLVNNDLLIDGKLEVIFIPNYSVSLTQLIIPATDLSEQISLAGTETSGISNMKLGMNGALTIGTLDSTSIEMCEYIGEDNIFTFGNTANQAGTLRRDGYGSRRIFRKDEELRQVLTQIGVGVFSPQEPGCYRDMLDSLVNLDDYYQVLADYRSYIDCQDAMDELYCTPRGWTAKTMYNITNMGYLSSDRTVQEYTDHI